MQVRRESLANSGRQQPDYHRRTYGDPALGNERNGSSSQHVARASQSSHDNCQKMFRGIEPCTMQTTR